jgi:hypothetical protein
MSGPQGPAAPGEEGAALFPSELACPHCRRPGVELGIRQSTTVWYRCPAAGCPSRGERRPPEELAGDD